MTIKTNCKKRGLRFGDFIAAAYRAWGRRRAKGFVRLAVNAHLVVFRGRQRVVITEEQHENLSSNPLQSELGSSAATICFSISRENIRAVRDVAGRR